MTLPTFPVAAGLVLILALGGCAGRGDTALRQACRAEDGRGNAYEASSLEMLDAVEDALQQCETAAVDPATCVLEKPH